MTYGFHAAAEAELQQAVDYYNACRANLGWEFAAEVQAAIQNIVAHPRLGHLCRSVPGGVWCVVFPMA